MKVDQVLIGKLDSKMPTVAVPVAGGHRMIEQFRILCVEVTVNVSRLFALCLGVLGLVLGTNGLNAQATSSLVFPGGDGKLEYVGYANEGETSEGNQLIDFSYAGYRGGGVAIPWVPVVATLDPMSGEEDDTDRVQEAIDAVSRLPLSTEGIRGALLLRAGEYHISQTLKIRIGGVVIRGEGQGSDGTVLRFNATEQDNLFEFEGRSGWNKLSRTEREITDPLVPSGTRNFRVESTEGLSIGDRLMILRTPNQEWIDLLQMGQWGWTPSAYASLTPRKIMSIDGDELTVDAPLVHAIDRRYGGGEVYRYRFNGALQNVGIERLRLESAFVSDRNEEHGWNAIQFSRTENAWARQITARYFGYSCVNIRQQCQRLTVEDCAQLDPKSILTGGRRYSFVIDDSSFILVQRCYTENGRHDFVTQSKTAGPIAFVDCLATRTHSDIGPHHRYSEGVLFDNVRGGQINVQNREDSGTGHGWAGAQIVFWNCRGSSIICDAPKGAMNFAIGCWGAKRHGSWAPDEPDGYWESRRVAVTPRSLYYRQLQDRLGVRAVGLVTTSAQREGSVWNELAAWGGDGQAPGVSTGAPDDPDLSNEVLAAKWLFEMTGISDPMAADWEKDYDGDGFSALLEFALGGSVTLDDSTIRPRLIRRSTGAVQPVHYQFNRRRQGLDPEDYQVEASESLHLGNWHPLGVDESLTVSHPTLEGFDLVTVPLFIDRRQRFVRLVIR